MKPELQGLYGLTEERLMLRETIKKYVEKEVVPLRKKWKKRENFHCPCSVVR